MPGKATGNIYFNFLNRIVRKIVRGTTKKRQFLTKHNKPFFEKNHHTVNPVFNILTSQNIGNNSIKIKFECSVITYDQFKPEMSNISKNIYHIKLEILKNGKKNIRKEAMKKKNIYIPLNNNKSLLFYIYFNKYGAMSNETN